MNSNQQITQMILDQLSKGVIPWTKPWVVNRTGIVSHDKGRPYGLRNRMLLEYGGEYATIHQINKAGGKVKKGEHGQTVFFAKYIDKKADTGEVLDTYYFLRAFTVFRVGSQTEGVEPKHRDLWECGGLPKQDDEVMGFVEQYARRVGLEMIGGGEEAFYSPSQDKLQVPGVGRFASRELFYHTLFHELVHSTGRSDRCKRPTGDSFGSSDYATEELVADIGACLCMGRAGLDVSKAVENSASYIAGWRSKIRNFKSSDFSQCVFRAEQATAFIFNEQLTEESNNG